MHKQKERPDLHDRPLFLRIVVGTLQGRELFDLEILDTRELANTGHDLVALVRFCSPHLLDAMIITKQINLAIGRLKRRLAVIGGLQFTPTTPHGTGEHQAFAFAIGDV